MRRAEIDKIFARMLGEYLADGYVINTNTMGGSQGEIAKVDLMKDGVFVRMSLWKDHNFRKPNADYYVLKVGKTSEPIRKGDHEIVWTDNLDEVERHVIYQIGKDWYSGNPEYTEDCMRKNSARLHNSWKHFDPLTMPCRYLPDSCRKAVLNRVRKMDGCHSVKLSDIKNVRKLIDDWHVMFMVDVRNKTVAIGDVRIA